MNPRLIALTAIGIVVIVLAGLGVFYFGDLLSTRALGPKGGRVSVRQGQTTVVEITTTKAPSVKIELCQEGTKSEKCQTLAAKATGKQATVKIPVKFPLGKAVIKVVERNAAGKLTATVQYRRAVSVVKGVPTPAPAAEQSGGDGGGGGGGDDGSSSSGRGAGEEANQSSKRIEVHDVCLNRFEELYMRYSPIGGYGKPLSIREVGASEWIRPVDEQDAWWIYHVPPENFYNFAYTGTYANKYYEVIFDLEPTKKYTFYTGPSLTPEEKNSSIVNFCDFRRLTFTTTP